MKLPLAISILTGALTLGTTAAAHPGGPGHRHAAVGVTPHVYVVPAPRIARSGVPYCATYGCSGSATATGPEGNTLTRTGSASCVDGTCTRSGSVTGPLGETATFNRSFSR